MKNINESLVKVNALLENAIANKKNEHYKSHYADLAAVREATVKILADHDLFITHDMVKKESGYFCVTRLIHAAGESLQVEIPLFFDKQDMQAIGKALTYAKRQGICMLLNLAHEKDDDGEDLRKQHEDKRKLDNLDERLTPDVSKHIAGEINRLGMREAYSAIFGEKKPGEWTRRDLKALNELIKEGEKKQKVGE